MNKTKIQFYVIKDDLGRYFRGFMNGNIHFSQYLDDAKFYDDKRKVRSVLTLHDYFNNCEVIEL
jgi:hypothetical protein